MRPKLPLKVRLAVIADYKAEMRQQAIAEKHNISLTSVSRIVQRHKAGVIEEDDPPAPLDLTFKDGVSPPPPKLTRQQRHVKNLFTPEQKAQIVELKTQDPSISYPEIKKRLGIEHVHSSRICKFIQEFHSDLLPSQDNEASTAGQDLVTIDEEREGPEEE